MITLKLLGARSFSCRPAGIEKVMMGKTVTVSDEHGDYLLGLTYRDRALTMQPLFSADVTQPTTHAKQAVEMSLEDRVAADKKETKRASRKSPATARKSSGKVDATVEV